LATYALIPGGGGAQLFAHRQCCQNLADPVAYRRDRRKDQLLQENGYFVLRFLAEDVGKELDAVLDAILRVLARRRQSAARVEPLNSSAVAVNDIADGLVDASGPRSWLD
jgi:hypothetical protein